MKALSINKIRDEINRFVDEDSEAGKTLSAEPTLDQVIPIPLTAEIVELGTEDEDTDVISYETLSDKSVLGDYVSFEKVNVQQTQFLNEWPDMTSLFVTSLTTSMTTFEVNDCLEIIGQSQTNSKTLILDLWSVSYLSSVFENSGMSLSDCKKNQAFRILENLTSFPIHDLEELKGILFSTSKMADSRTFKHIDTQNMGHFVYYSFSLLSGELTLIDSLSNSFETSPYFDRDTTKKFFSRLYTLFGGSARNLKPIRYHSNAFRQQGVECGYNALINLVLSLKYTGDFLHILEVFSTSKLLCASSSQPSKFLSVL